MQILYPNRAPFPVNNPDRPASVRLIHIGTARFPGTADTVFGYATDRLEILRSDGTAYRIQPGMYFAVPTPCDFYGSGLFVCRHGYRRQFLIGGPVDNSNGHRLYLIGTEYEPSIYQSEVPPIPEPCTMDGRVLYPLKSTVLVIYP